jgi:hypothetical protein
LFSALFLIISFSIFAQEDVLEDKKSKLTFGVSIGANVSFFNTPVSELGNQNSLGYNSFFRLGVNFNGRVFYKLNDFVRLESGAAYSGKGEEYRKKNNNVIIINQGGVENGYYKTRFRIDYFEIPFITGVNLKKLFKKPNFNDKPIFVNFGVSAAFNMKSDIKSNYYSPTGSSSSPIVDVEEQFRTTQFDFAKPFVLNFIVGVDFTHYQMKDSDFIVGVLFSQTLGNVYESQNISSIHNYKTSNSTFTLRVGFNFK